MLKRSLSCQSAGFVDEINLTVETPKEINPDEFICCFGINGGGFSINKSVIGIDSMQSVLLAIKIIKNVILNSDAYRSGNIYWLEKDNGIDL